MTVFMPSDQVETFRASRLMKRISKSRTDAAFEEGCVKPKNINRSSKKEVKFRECLSGFSISKL